MGEGRGADEGVAGVGVLRGTKHEGIEGAEVGR